VHPATCVGREEAIAFSQPGLELVPFGERKRFGRSITSAEDALGTPPVAPLARVDDVVPLREAGHPSVVVREVEQSARTFDREPARCVEAEKPNTSPV